MRSSTVKPLTPEAISSRKPLVRCVLLVEDNPGDAELVRDGLSRSHPDGNFSIKHVVTLAEADKACAAAEFDCIVLDLQLPDSSGVDTIREMRARHPDAAIVVYSGLENEGARALSAGAQDFVCKSEASAGALGRSIVISLERSGMIKMRRQFENLLEGNSDAMIVSGADGAVHFVNAAARRMFDHDAADFVSDFGPFELHEGDVSEITFSHDGQQFTGEIRVIKCFWEGEQAVFACVHDVTEQKALAERERNAQLIGRLAGGCVHDLGNVLSCIDVFANLADAEQGRHPSALLGHIKTAVEQGRAIVRQLALLERGGPGVPERVMLGDILCGLGDFLRCTLPLDIDLVVDCGLDLWPVTIGPGQIEQVILNLALNARDAMPKGGVLRIDCVNQAATERSGDGVTLRVTDTGHGIAAAHLPKVFDLCFTTKADDRGAGRGLAMCRAIVEGAGGAISVHSKPGAGACFTIWLAKAC